MKKFWIKLGALAMVLMMSVLFAGCTNEIIRYRVPGNFRTPVRDGVFDVQAWGYNNAYLMHIRTIIASNAIVSINIISTNSESFHIINSVRDRFIPRIIHHQSLGVDSIAGATYTSVGIVNAVAEAIYKAGGDVDEWFDPPPRRSGLVQLFDYDVIVVGLGGSGIVAYLAASEVPGTSVFGIEAAGVIGGNTGLAGGPFAVNSQFIARQYGLPEIHIDRDALLQRWWGDYGVYVPADVLATENVRRSSFVPPIARQGWWMPGPAFIPGTASFNLPVVNSRVVMPYSEQTRGGGRGGGGRWDLIRTAIDESGPALDWLAAPPYNWPFRAPSALSFAEFPIVVEFGDGVWNTGGAFPEYGNDDHMTGSTFNIPDAHKINIFERSLFNARIRHPRNDFMLELRATELITVDGDIVGVRARYFDGTTFEIFGRSVVLATGGFVGDPDEMFRRFGFRMPSFAQRTSRGDGIRMAIRDAGAGTYNIDQAPSIHVSDLLNRIRNHIHPLGSIVDGEPWTVERARQYKFILGGMLLKSNNINIALNIGPAGLDFRGHRWVNEAGGAGSAGPPFMGWRAGGLFGAIFTDEQIEDIRVRGTRVAMPNNFQVPFSDSRPGFDGVFTGAPFNAANVPIPFINEVLQVGYNTGNVIRGDTLRELVQNLHRRGLVDFYGLSVEAFAQRIWYTITAYNTQFPGYEGTVLEDPVARWNDYLRERVTAASHPGFFAVASWPWNKPRTEANFTHPQVNPGANIDDPVGFVLVLGASYPYGTTGGLDINNDMQVLRENPSSSMDPELRPPIRGLFAVGQESMGVLFDRNKYYARYGAIAFGWNLVSGRIAGTNAALEAQRVRESN